MLSNGIVQDWLVGGKGTIISLRHSNLIEINTKYDPFFFRFFNFRRTVDDALYWYLVLGVRAFENTNVKGLQSTDLTAVFHDPLVHSPQAATICCLFREPLSALSVIRGQQAQIVPIHMELRA
mmetsp:Transcript_11642/g.19066  ORF Transcript_11642/g.19066 Transcript_11642/m.19066 type:complete len:123 (-) Transcript_11642:13-381(-)